MYISIGGIFMGLFDNLLGNASKANLDDIRQDYAKLLANGESIQQAYEIFRDLFIFTDKRLILVDKQGITGKKTQYHSIPYKSIRHFSIETAGHFDLDAELKIYVAGMDMPIIKKFDKSLDIYQLQAILAEYVLRLNKKLGLKSFIDLNSAFFINKFNIKL